MFVPSQDYELVKAMLDEARRQQREEIIKLVHEIVPTERAIEIAAAIRKGTK